jgi:hypothetical protein
MGTFIIVKPPASSSRLGIGTLYQQEKIEVHQELHDGQPEYL